MAAPPPTVISLFTGVGGLDYGFEAAGCETAVAVEKDEICAKTLRQSRTWPVLAKDIHTVPIDEILEAGSLRRKEVDIVIGGPPCQPFSKSGYWAAGDVSRMEDPRASTLRAMLRLVRDVKPRAILIENVDGIQFRGKDEGLAWLLAEMACINAEVGTQYLPAVKVLNAADYGVPQRRRRLFIVAGRDGQTFRFPDHTHCDSPEKRRALDLEPHRTAWDALGDLEDDESDELQPSGHWAELLPSIPEGHNYQWHTDRGGGLPLFGWRRRYWSFLLKLAKDRPSWTIQANPGPATGPFHWQSRLLSARELCRLQTIPDDVEIAGDRRAMQRQIGSAVPSLLAEVIARAIREQLLDGRSHEGPLKLLPTCRGDAPEPEPVAEVPEIYHSHLGAHAPHPGEGLGPRASERAA